jgi:hypothetical protein
MMKIMLPKSGDVRKIHKFHFMT